MGNRLLVARDEITGRVARYDYDEFDNLISAEYERGGEVERLYRVPDRVGNLFETREKDDRRYDAGGRLAEDREHFYHYDCEGNLVFKEFKEMALRGGIVAPINKERLETELGIRFRAFGTGWRYDWQSDGMLARVVRPDGKEVSFAYDALGRRIRKTYAGATTHFVWDGNVPLHEWTETAEVSESSETEKNGTGNNNLITWLFEQGTFVPAAKLMSNGDCFSIVSDYLGTPMQAYDKNGDKVWEQELDIYGRQRKRPSSFIPFKYQGQYADKETGLYYNRFRYYAPRTGAYISQDPIGLMGGNPTLYGYVKDPNAIVDFYGLIVVYRAVNPIQESSVNTGTSIQPKDANANYSIQEHVENGKLNTQYISTTKEMNRAEFYAKSNKSTIIAINIDKIEPKKIIDISNGIDPQTGKPLQGKAFGYATKDAEVLIDGEIPKEAYTVVKKHH